MQRSTSSSLRAPIPFPLSPSQARVKIRAEDHWVLIGATGSGKTVALKYLDNCYTRLFPTMRHYVLDSKMDGDFDDWPGVVQLDVCPPRPGRNQRYQVWQPVSLIPEQIERWLYGILKDA